MNPTPLEKQIALVAQLTHLVQQLDIFINGDADAAVVTTGGLLVKSIAGINRDLRAFRYVQRVIDHRLYADMLVADIENGMLVRIWGDTVLINGLYQKTTVLGFVKISYSDIYDLTAPPAPVGIATLLL